MAGIGGWRAFSDPRAGRAGNRPPDDGRVELAEEVAQAFLPVFFLPALGPDAPCLSRALAPCLFWNCRAFSDRPVLNRAQLRFGQFGSWMHPNVFRRRHDVGLGGSNNRNQVAAPFRVRVSIPLR